MNKFLRSALLGACPLAFAVASFATTPLGYVSLSSNQLQDSTGNLIANATLHASPVNNSGSPLGFRVNGLGQSVSSTVATIVTNGVFTIQLADTALTLPINICYSLTVTDNVSGRQLLGPGYSCVQPAGSGSAVSSGFCTAATSVGGACSFDVYPPNEAALVVTQTGPAGPTGPAGAGFIPGLTSNGTNGINVAGTVAATSAVVNAINGTTLRGRAWTANGDSITAGYGPCGTTEPCAQAYAPLIAAAQGWTLTNEGNNGDQLYDQNLRIYADPPVTATSVSSLLIGENELNYNPPSYPEPEWIASLRAAYLWKLAPNLKSGQSSACATSGTWASDTWLPNYNGTTVGSIPGVLATNTNGSTWTCSFYGTTGYLIVGATTTTYPAFNVTITSFGGSPVTQLQPQGVAQISGGAGCINYQCNLFTPFLAWSTPLGTGRPNTCPTSSLVASCTSAYALRFAGLNNGLHVMTVTYVSAYSTDKLRIIGVAGNGNQLTNTGPYDYAATMYKDAAHTDAQLDGLDQNIQQVTDELSGDGLGIANADVRGACYTSNLLPNCNGYDGTHPNAANSITIANEFLKLMNFSSMGQVNGTAAKTIPFQGAVGGDLCGVAPNVYICNLNGQPLTSVGSGGTSAFLGLTAAVNNQTGPQFTSPNCAANAIAAGPGTGSSPGSASCRPLVQADFPSTLSTRWNYLGNPTGNLTLSMPLNNASTFTWTGGARTTFNTAYVFGADTGSPTAAQFFIEDTTGNTSTGPMLEVESQGTSTAMPVKFCADGGSNCIEMTGGASPVLQAIGTASIIATSATNEVTSFSAPSVSWPTWLVPTVTTSTTTPSLTVAASTIPASIGGTGEAGTVTGVLYGNGTSAHTASTAAQMVSAIGSTAVTNATNATTSNQVAGLTGVVYGNGTSTATAATSAQVQTLIGSNVYEPVTTQGIPKLTIGTAIASATTIAPVSPAVHITGTTAIATITAPTGCTTAGVGCQVTLIPDALWTTTTAGNIAIASTAVLSKVETMTYDPATAKWYPSY